MALPPSNASRRADAPPRPAIDAPVFESVAEEGVDLRELLDILLRGRWLIAAAVLLLAIPVAVYQWMQPSLYSSDSIILVDKQNTSLADVLPSQPSAAFFRNERNLGNELLVLNQSLPLAEDVAASLLDLGSVPETGRPLRVVAAATGRVPGAEAGAVSLDSTQSVRALALWLQRYVVNASMEGSDADALRIGAVSEDPAEAALIANAYTDAFIRLTRENSRSGMAASREFLEEQVGDRSADLERLDAEVRDFMLREGAVALDEETSRLVSQIAQLEAGRDAADVRIRTQRAALDALQGELRRLEPRLSERLESGLDAQLASAQARVAEVQAELRPFYVQNPDLRTDPAPPPAVARLQAELARAEAEVRAVSDRLANQSLASGSGPGDQRTGLARANALRDQVSDARVQLRSAQAERDQLSARLGQYEAELDRIPRQSIELAQLQRRRMAAEQLSGALTQNLQEARVAEQSQLGYARLIRPALAALEPFSPNRARNVLLAVLLGLFAGAALAVARVRLDHRIHRPDDIRQAGVPLIGTVPSTDELIARDFDGAETTLVGGREVDTHVVTLLNPMAAASEAYRALRTSVQFSRPDVVVQTILVTSSNPGEGKSVTSANLAVTMAQAGRRVLLIDADLRKPTAHRKLGLPREPGLVQALFDEIDISPANVPQVGDDLHVLTAGSLAPNPSELLGSMRMRDLIVQAREDYDVVIVDAPPVLAATDAVLLSTQCDATIVVVRAGQTHDYDLDATLEALDSVGASVIGTVLNGFDTTKAYGYRYKYAVRYGSDYAYGSDQA